MYKETKPDVFNALLTSAMKKAQRAAVNSYDVFEDGGKKRDITIPILMNRAGALMETFKPGNETTMENPNDRQKDTERKNLVVSTAYAVHMLNTFCAREALMEQVDAFLSDEDKLVAYGISTKDVEPLKKEIIGDFDAAFKADPDTREIAEFIEKVDAANPTAEQRQKFIYDSVNMLCNLENRLDRSADEEVFNNTAQFGKDTLQSSMGFNRYSPNSKNILMLRDYIKDVADKFDKDNYMKVVNFNNIGISFGEKIHPTTFLEHFNESPENLTPEELDWAHKLFTQMSSFSSVSAEDGKPHLYNIDINDFQDEEGFPIIRQEDIKRALEKDEDGEVNPNKYTMLEAVVVAKVLSGEKVTAWGMSQEGNEKVLINPEIERPEEPKFSIANFFKWLWEKLTSSIGKEAAKVDEMNEKFDKNKGEINAVRTKIDFKELSKTNAIDKLNNHIEKLNEKTVSLDGPRK